MKSVLGLLGLSVLVFSCGGNGDALFDPVKGDPTAGSSGSMSTSGSGGESSGTGGKAMGGSSSSGSGGQSTSGTSGTPNTGGGGTGPGTPEVIYVATGGADDAECGLTPETACKSISQGAARAVEAGRTDVYVQAGTYAGVAVLKPGVHVIGGFDTAWQTGDRTDDAHQVVLEGGVHEGEYLAVLAHDLDVEASLENLLITAPTAEGQKAETLDGKSSYGIHAVSSTLSIKNVDITAGNGANGADGSMGQDAERLTATADMNGKVGGVGTNNDDGCDASVALGGNPGTNSCDSSPSATLMSGGRGGDGGAGDTKCTFQVSWIAAPGSMGSEAAFTSGTFGKGGTGGTGSISCGPTTGGQPGAVSNGAGGKAAGGGYVTGNFWYGSPGGNGATGNNGGGGGGGGGAGGCDPSAGSANNDGRGPAGGGGGAGGCAARGGGGGGGGGGASFGIFAVGSTLNLEGVNVTRGNGGGGGNGGAGGQGQSGGVGQSGGANPGANNPGTAAAGSGGNGAHGGHGGGGAGGAGGRAYGIVLTSNSSLAGTVTITGGAAGGGGDGGASAPNAPQAERDGNPGEAGADGSIGDTLDCGAETSC